MKNMNKIELARWIILGPVVFISSTIIFGLGIFFFEDFLDIRMYNEGGMVMAAVAAITVPVWLLLTYLIAPKHKVKSIWFSYILGSAFIIFISALGYSENSSNSKEMATALLLSSLSSGLLVCLVIQIVSKSGNSSFFKNIDKYITTSN